MVGRLYTPAPLVVVSRVKLVVCSVATTFAPTTAAWLASVTLPVILPWSNWACAGSTHTIDAPKTAKKKAKNTPDPKMRLIIAITPVRHSPNNPRFEYYDLTPDCCGPARLRTSRCPSGPSPTTAHIDAATDLNKTGPSSRSSFPNGS